VPAQGTGLLISALRRQLAQATANLTVAEKRAADAETRAELARKSAREAWECSRRLMRRPAVAVPVRRSTPPMTRRDLIDRA
jgi:hypothetical protein